MCGVHTVREDVDECIGVTCGGVLAGSCTEVDGEAVAGTYTCTCADGYQQEKPTVRPPPHLI